MESPLIKSILTGFAAIAYWYSLTPPHYPSDKDNVHVDGVFGFIAHKLSLASKTAVVSSLACQVIVLTALSHPSFTQSTEALSRLCYSRNPYSITSLSPLFLAGSLLVISMAIVRAWCYHALGTLFTFQITIRQDHRLVTTGPYAYVRHPAYTSLILALVGVLIMSLDGKSWINQCNMMSTSVGGWVYAFVFLCIFSASSMLGRGKIEDEQLKKVFGEEWLTYSRQVPHRFIPGIW